MSIEFAPNKRTVIITGAAGNLGRKVVDSFLNCSYQVVALVSALDQKAAFGSHPALQVFALDLRNEKAVEEWAGNEVGRLGQISGLLCLAGGFAMGNFQNTGLGDLEQQWSLNFTTAYHISRVVFVHMLEKKSGRIVFVGARPALEPAQGKDLLAYSLSKSLLFKLAEFINAEAKGLNVTASVVVPSTLDTPANRSGMPQADFSSWVSLDSIADLLEMIVSEKGSQLRETVLKIYNNA